MKKVKAFVVGFTGQKTMRRTSTLALLALLCLICASCASRKVPTDARLVLKDNDIRRINQGLAQGSFVFTIPTGTEAPPTTCPKPTQPNCIWICTGTDPLDGIDDNTCSTNTYCCYGCGEGGVDVCQSGQ